MLQFILERLAVTVAVVFALVCTEHWVGQKYPRMIGRYDYCRVVEHHGPMAKCPGWELLVPKAMINFRNGGRTFTAGTRIYCSWKVKVTPLLQMQFDVDPLSLKCYDESSDTNAGHRVRLLL